MGKRKSYLSQQVKLLGISTTDLLTEEEFALYMEIVNHLNELERLVLEAKRRKGKADAAKKAELLASKTAAQQKLDKLIAQHAGTPRQVRVSGVMDTRFVEKDADGQPVFPPGVNWIGMRNSRKIAEFMSDMSRFFGLKADEVTFDKIIVRWKNQEILRQLVMDGFILPILHPDGTLEQRKFVFVTASAGQLRTDRTVFLSEQAWAKIHDHIFCGLSEEIINQHAGLNIS